MNVNIKAISLAVATLLLCRVLPDVVHAASIQEIQTISAADYLDLKLMHMASDTGSTGV
jgi:hypothetical protein